LFRHCWTLGLRISLSLRLIAEEDCREEERKKVQDSEKEPQSEPHRVRLPGFLVEENVGLGDAIKRVSYAMGIKPCGGCEKRASALNRWMYFIR
jgi:hypothetical protein